MSTTTSKKMTYVRLGNSGLKVSRIILGTMQYGDKDWQQWVIDDEEEAFKHIKFAYDAGITTFDTADAYSNGRSEEILGAAIKKLGLPREELVILTKVYGAIGPKGVNVHQHGKTPEDYGIINQKGLSRKHIFDAVQASLKRLQLEYIDILQCHRFDYDTPIEETMQALHDVVKAGYVRYIGMSSCYAYQFTAMQNYAITNKLTPFISMQNHYNLLYREEEREMLPTLKSFGVGVIPWSPLARGALTRPYDEIQATSRGKSDLWATHYPGAGVPGIIKRVEELAKKKGVTMAQVAVAWTLSKDSVTAPIVGTTKLQNLEEIIAAIDIKLTDEEIKSLEEPYQPTKVFGHL